MAPGGVAKCLIAVLYVKLKWPKCFLQMALKGSSAYSTAAERTATCSIVVLTNVKLKWPKSFLHMGLEVTLAYWLKF